MTIPEWPQAGEREAEMLRDVLNSPQWGGFHPFVSEFERSFAAYQHAKHAISAANGTLTLELALDVLGIGRGDEVILPAISFISSASAIARLGAVPVFVDIGEDSFNIDVPRVKEAITPRTKAVMAVHFGGVLCDLPALQRLCDETGVALLEDAAHAHGSEWNGQRAGSFGRFGSFSFQNGKVLTAGEGGALVTSDDALAEQAQSIANCGRKAGCNFYEHYNVGTNVRLTAFQAAVLICQLDRLPAQIKRRTENAQLLKHLLADVEEIIWQQEPAEQTQNPQYLLTGRLKNSAADHHALCSELSTRNIPCSPFYPHTLYQNPVFKNVACRVLECPVAEARINDGFWLGHRLLLADEETIRECAVLMRSAIVSRTLARA
jgi:dTDP-4-amino-4,6-dideoxygalactose transaminase